MEVKFSICRTIFVNFFAWIVLFLLMLFFSIYQACVDIILKIKLGKKYGGLFDKFDMVWCLKGTTKMCITSVLYIKSDKKINIMQRVKNVFQKQVFDNPELYPKLTCSKGDFGGYPYWIKNGCKLNDVLRPLKVPNNVTFNEDYLKEITGKITSSEYDKNCSILWEIYANEEPLICDNNENGYYYPVIIRFHHAIADGTSFVALLLRIFGDQVAENYGDSAFNKLMQKELKQKGNKFTFNIVKSYLVKLFVNFYFWLDVIFLSLGRYVEWCYFRPIDKNALHTPNHSEDRRTFWSIEDRVECVPMVKKIKNRTNTQFTRVVNTAMAASLTNYFRKRSEPIPDHISGLITALLYYTPQNQSEPIKLMNKTSICFFELPAIEESENLLQSLEQVTKMMSKNLTYSDVLIARFIIAFAAGYIPPTLVAKFLGFDGKTFLLTNVPGAAKIKVLGGCTLEKIVPIAPNIRSLGVTFAILTYDDRFQIGLIVDNALIKSKPEIQSLADDVLRYIKLMDAQCKKKWEDY